MFQDAARGVYKKIVVKDDKIRGAVLYGDTVDGAWYFQLLRDGTPIADFRESLLFGQAHRRRLGPRRARPPSTALPDNAEICGCNGVCKGDIVKAITDEEPVHARRGPRAHQGLLLLRLVHGPRRATAREHARRRLLRGAREEADVHVHDLHARGSAPAIVREKLKSIPRVMQFLEWKTPDGCHKCRPALNFYLLCAWPGEYEDDKQSRFVNERAHGNIQKDGTYSVVPRIWGGVTSAKELRAIADVAEKYAVPTVKVTGGQRHRSARRQEGRPAGDVEAT